MSVVAGVYVAVMFAFTAVLPAVNVAAHEAVPTGLVPWARVQGEVVPKEPVPCMAKATVPAGVETVPGLVEGSTTVAVHVEVPPTVTVAGLQETDVVVGLRLTVTVTAVLVLPA